MNKDTALSRITACIGSGAVSHPLLFLTFLPSFPLSCRLFLFFLYLLFILYFPFIGIFLSVVFRSVFLQKSLHCNLRNYFVSHSGLDVSLSSGLYICLLTDLQNTFRFHGYSENMLKFPTHCRIFPVLQASLFPLHVIWPQNDFIQVTFSYGVA